MNFKNWIHRYFWTSIKGEDLSPEIMRIITKKLSRKRGHGTITIFVKGKTWIYRVRVKRTYIENHGHGGAIGLVSITRKLRKKS